MCHLPQTWGRGCRLLGHCLWPPDAGSLWSLHCVCSTQRWCLGLTDHLWALVTLSSHILLHRVKPQWDHSWGGSHPLLIPFRDQITFPRLPKLGINLQTSLRPALSMTGQVHGEHRWAWPAIPASLDAQETGSLAERATRPELGLACRLVSVASGDARWWELGAGGRDGGVTAVPAGDE